MSDETINPGIGLVTDDWVNFKMTQILGKKHNKICFCNDK